MERERERERERVYDIFLVTYEGVKGVFGWWEWVMCWGFRLLTTRGLVTMFNLLIIII